MNKNVTEVLALKEWFDSSLNHWSTIWFIYRARTHQQMLHVCVQLLAIRENTSHSLNLQSMCWRAVAHQATRVTPGMSLTCFCLTSLKWEFNICLVKRPGCWEPPGLNYTTDNLSVFVSSLRPWTHRQAACNLSVFHTTDSLCTTLSAGTPVPTVFQVCSLPANWCDCHTGLLRGPATSPNTSQWHQEDPPPPLQCLCLTADDSASFVTKELVAKRSQYFLPKGDRLLISI